MNLIDLGCSRIQPFNSYLMASHNNVTIVTNDSLDRSRVMIHNIILILLVMF